MSSHVELNPDDSTLGLSLGMKAMRLALTQKTHKMGTVRIPGTGGTDVIIGDGAQNGANRIDQDGNQMPLVDTSGIDKAAQDAQQSADKAMAKADEAIAKGEQIRRDAQAGIEDARKQAQAADAKADQVRTDLETAASQLESNIAAVDAKADQVRSDLTRQVQDAKSEMDSTVKAAQSSADKAQSAADAAQKAADKANASTADLDKSIKAVDAKAIAAKQAAAEAQSKAENVASDLDSANAVIEQHTTELGELTTKVSNAVKKSDSALSVSTEAKQTATEASTTATSAYKDSQTALTQSTTATQTATAAKTTAESAGKTASDSLKQSSAAVQTANQISTTLRTEYQTKADADKLYATQSSLKQTSDSITASVSKTYATKDALSTLQNVADNAIESWRGTGVPTLTNKPASDWTTDAKRKKHSGDLYYDKATGKAYRFGSDDGETYTWELNQDTDVTKALADASRAQTSANNAQASATAANTAAGKAQSTANTAVSNAATAKNAADAAQSSANKAQGDVDKLKIDIPETYATKSSLAQTAESITANVESVKTTANSAVTAASKAQQTADGISANLTKNYQTKSQTDTIYATKASLKATSDSISAEVTKAQGTADGAVTAASKAQQTADAVTLNLSKNYNTKAQNDALYATKTSLKATSDSLSAKITANAKTAQSAVDKATSLEANLNGFKTTVAETYQTKSGMSAYATNSSLTQTANSIKAQVAEVSKTANGAMSKATTVEQTANGLSSKITEQGKTLNATVKTANEAKSTADSNKTTISQTANLVDAALAGDNLITDGGFESTEWWKGLKTPFRISTGSYYHGKHVLVCDAATGDNRCPLTHEKGMAGTATTIPVTKGRTYRLSGYCAWYSSVPSNVNPYGDKLRLAKPDGSFIAGAQCSKSMSWSETHVDWKCPDDGSITSVRIEVMHQANGSILWDDVAFRDITEAAETSNRVSSVQQNLDGFKTTVAKTYQDKAGMSNYATNSALKQTSDTITSQVSEVSKTASGAMSKVTSLEQTANGLSTKITEQGKTLDATVKTANEAKSTADSNKTAISQVSTTANNALSKTSSLEQNLSGFKTSVANTYTTKADFNNLTIGGTNLLLNTSGVFVGHPSASGVNANAGWLPRLVDGLTYSTLSAGTYQLRFEVMTDTEVGSYIVQWADTPWGISSFSLSKGVWKTLTYTIVKPDGATGKARGFMLRTDNVPTSATIRVRRAKLERGSRPTDWSPAPQDSQAAGDYATNSSLTQTASQIRSEVAEKYQSKSGMSSYATTSALTQKANEITGKVQEVAKTAQGNTTTISQVSQKADRINTTLSQQISGKADTSRVSSLEQNLDGFKTSVAKTYQTKGDYPTKAEVQSRIDQSASSIKSTVGQTYTTLAATEALRKSATRTFTLTGAAGKAKWVKLGYLTSNGDDSSVLIHVYSGNGYNGQASQNAEFEIFVKDGLQQSASATRAFGVSVSRIRNADDVKVKVMAFSSTTCDIWAYMPWTYWNGHYTLQGDYKSWQDGPNCGGTRIQDAEPTSGTAQDLAYDTLSTRSYVDQTSKSVALGVVQNYKGADGSGLATKSDITVAKNSVTSTVASTYATKSGVTQEISSKITQNNNSLDVKFATKSETKTAQATANTAKSNASDAKSRVGTLEDCISLTSAGVRAGHQKNGVFNGVSALVNTDGSFDLLDKDGKLLTRIDRHSLQVAGDNGVGSGHLILSQDGLDITVQPTANKTVTYHIQLGAGGISITAPDGAHVECSARTGLDLETVKYGKLSIGSGGLQFTNDQGWGLALSAAGWSLKWAGNHTLATGPTAGALYIDGRQIVTR